MSVHWTDQQARFFDTFGFLKLPGLFKDSIGEITEEFERVWKTVSEERPGKIAEDGPAIYMPFIDRSEKLSRLIDDPRLHDIAASVLGEDFNYMGCDGHLAGAGDGPWHHDGRENLRFIRFFFYLDPLTAESGALRVIPGSHKIGDSFANSVVAALTGAGDVSAEGSLNAEERKALREAYEKMSEEERAEAMRKYIVDRGQVMFGVANRDLPAAVLENEPGDVMLFDHRILHAIFGGRQRRRRFTINLSQRASEPLLPAMRDWVKFHLRISTPDPLVGSAMLDTAGPERMRHLEQVLAHQDELHELILAEAR